MKRIELTQGKFAIVDEDDFEKLSKFNWHYVHGYAKRNIRLKNGKRSTVFMHRVIMNTPEGYQTDHINGNGLDNRKENLRNCTQSENQRNRPKHKGEVSKYKGVVYYKTKRHKTGKWLAKLTVDKETIYLGHYYTEKEAAKAYNEAAIKYYGEFAQLNEVDDEMDFTNYQSLSSRTIPKNKWLNTNLSNFGMGLAGEAGEIVDYLKKVIYHDHELDKEKVKEELGDLLWYVSSLSTILGVNLEDVAINNVNKLIERYPDGFEAERSINRGQS